MWPLIPRNGQMELKPPVVYMILNFTQSLEILFPLKMVQVE
jgi:hypothetical protein